LGGTESRTDYDFTSQKEHEKRKRALSVKGTIIKDEKRHKRKSS